jgi:Polyketide cyclase / dehydrase and lipid transport
MARYAATVTSQHPAPDTFSYLATFTNTADWDPGVISAEQLDGGPVRPGTRFRLVVPFLGRRLPLTYQVVTLVPGREIVLAGGSRLLRATDRIVVDPAGDGATVNYQADVRLRGPLALLDTLLRPGFRAVGQRAAAGLAQVLGTPWVTHQVPQP